MVSVGIVASLLFKHVLAQHHHHGHDPFAGSGCNCSAFCSNECSINATGKTSVTQYRMTQFGVVDMRNKNTGDVAGDTSFVISRRTTAYECRKDPGNFMCVGGLAKFSGDDPNSTDLVLEWSLDIDGKWGPYLECNPLDSKNSLGGWECSDDMFGRIPNMPKPPPSYPSTCTAYKGAAGFCLDGFQSKTVVAEDLAACCAAASTRRPNPWSGGSEPSQAYTFFENKTCALYHFAFSGARCHGAVSGVLPPPPPPPPGTPGAECMCKRVNETVGREPLGSGGYGGYNPAGGTWFSYPAMGECKPGAEPGDSSGCTWKAAKIIKAINATCLYRHIDDNIEVVGKPCFSQCPPDPTRMTDCYLKCYSETVSQMTSKDLSQPWGTAFAKNDVSQGGCPVVKQICDSGSKRSGCPQVAREYEAMMKQP